MEDQKHVKIYCDESRQNNHRYMVLGGVSVPAKSVGEVRETMAKFREELGMKAELKWTKVSSSKLESYKRFIDYFFALNDTDRMRFHCLIVDNYSVNNSRYNSGDREIGFYKFYYQLLLHCFGRKYCGKDHQGSLHVRLDQRVSSQSLSELKNILNNGMASRWGVSTRPFKTLEPRDSKRSELLQLVDLVIGSIGYEKNGHEILAGSSPAKVALLRYIRRKSGCLRLGNCTPKSQTRFTVWNFRLRK